MQAYLMAFPSSPFTRQSRYKRSIRAQYIRAVGVFRHKPNPKLGFTKNSRVNQYKIQNLIFFWHLVIFVFRNSSSRLNLRPGFGGAVSLTIFLTARPRLAEFNVYVTYKGTTLKWITESIVRF